MSAEVLLPVVTLVLGIVLGHVLDWHKEKRREARERVARRKATQREGIIEVQDLAWELHRLESELQWAVSRYHRATGKWPSRGSHDYEHDRTIALNAINTSARLVLLQSRLDDKELKDLIRAFNGATRKMNDTKGEEEAKQAANASIQALGRLNERTAELLEDLY